MKSGRHELLFLQNTNQTLFKRALYLYQEAHRRVGEKVYYQPVEWEVLSHIGDVEMNFATFVDDDALTWIGVTSNDELAFNTVPLDVLVGERSMDDWVEERIMMVRGISPKKKRTELRRTKGSMPSFTAWVGVLNVCLFVLCGIVVVFAVTAGFMNNSNWWAWWAVLFCGSVTIVYGYREIIELLSRRR